VSYASVNDVGRVVNPLIVIGQLDGGAVQGIGQALCENFVYDAETGRRSPARSWTTRCRARRSSRISARRWTSPRPCLNNAMGVKGVGELGTIGATPAVVNAVLDALARAGSGSLSTLCRCR
jgi:carbon-monoxide dehydrogenase large subunit